MYAASAAMKVPEGLLMRLRKAWCSIHTFLFFFILVIMTLLLCCLCIVQFRWVQERSPLVTVEPGVTRGEPLGEEQQQASSRAHNHLPFCLVQVKGGYGMT